MGNSIHYFVNSIQIVDGFDLVGKSLFAKEILPNHSIYHCKHKETSQNSWIVGYNIIDFIEQSKIEDKIIIEQGIASSVVYDRIYNNHNLDQRILEWYKNNQFFKNQLGHIYIKHHDASTAQEIFENSLEDKSAFNTFNDYWMLYNYADQLYSEAYNSIGIKPRIFELSPNMEWREIK